MSDVADGIGGAIEGALVGRAVEPQRGEASLDPSIDTGDERTCPNCGALATSNFCPECGQKTHIHRTLSAIMHDLVHGVLHLDGKLWRTLPLLTFKPGELTRRYIEGERAQFVSPMAMFLFSVFAMFAIFQIVGISTPTTFDDGSVGIEEVSIDDVETNLGDALSQVDSELAEVDGRLADPGLDEEDRAELAAKKASLEEDRAQLRQMADLPFITVEGQDTDAAAVAESSDAASTDTNSSESEMNGTGIEWIDEGLVKKWRDNPGLMLYKLQANAYKFSWLLIPLSIPFVWLLFAWKRRFKAYDHAIFVTYSLGFTSLLFIVISVFFTIPSLAWIGGLLMTFVPPIHLYKHLRGTYGLSRFSAFWRLMVLSVFIWIVVALFLQALLLLGAF